MEIEERKEIRKKGKMRKEGKYIIKFDLIKEMTFLIKLPCFERRNG